MVLVPELLVAFANAMAANEKVQRKFRNAMLIRLSGIDAMLTEVQGAQLAEYWSPGRVTDDQRAKIAQEVEERVSRASDQLGLKMVRYIISWHQTSMVVSLARFSLCTLLRLLFFAWLHSGKSYWVRRSSQFRRDRRDGCGEPLVKAWIHGALLDRRARRIRTKIISGFPVAPRPDG
jgi:hypothetical protein